ncbi:adenylosuccinate lyase [Enterococcus sp. OL5]|uniref:adenylosuccinate lyase n=1 Tax=Enterococcus sp. OL5 TaxID=2590214 RepID=UPI0011296F07|nr:adenylosuccinate lyase [Enterococcus sp. OL5]TPR55120.1 adenylosuccinate lyase [Enterococcus sp. OL5]
MGAHVIDLVMLKNNFGTAEMREIWKDTNRLRQHLKIEGALAQAEGELGIIPSAAAQKIQAATQTTTNYSVEDIAAEAARIKHSFMATINAIQKEAGAAGEYVHFGATTQDIVDTGAMLQLKQSYLLIRKEVQDIIERLAKASKSYQYTTMVGRTHGMQALPTTFGYKLAVWLDEFGRHLERLLEMKDRVFVGNLNGAIGSYASFGPQGIEVEKRTLELLELGVPTISWQSARDRFSEYASVLALISGTLGKIGNEFYNLMRTEINELEEGFSKGKIGSSTMPHKRNPAAFEGLASLTPAVLKSVALIHESMHVEHERDAMSWRLEWIALPEINIYVSAQLASLKAILGDLRVNEAGMRTNLERQQGLLLSEKVMFEVGKKLGKQTAHHLVYECAMQAFEEQRLFAEILLEQPQIAKNYTKAEIEAWLVADDYIGLAAEKVDQVIAHLKERKLLKEQG